MQVEGSPLEMRPEEWVSRLGPDLLNRLLERALEWSALGVTAPAVEDMLALLTAVVPVAVEHPLDAEVGPFYVTAGVQAVLGGVSRQAVASRREHGTVLAARTADGRWVYPTWQFVERDVDPALVPAIRALHGCPEWAVALWFKTPNPDLDDVSPLDWAHKDMSAEALVASARATAREWA